MIQQTLFDDTYRTETLRLPERDYSEPGSYFVTICTSLFQSCLGQVRNGEMVLSTYGEIVRQEVCNIEDGQVEVDACVIMPNHIHVIISIKEGFRRDNSRIISPGCGLGDSSGTVSTGNINVTRRRMILPKVIGKFKMQTAKRINLVKGTSGKPFWQSNYYEHVIRDERDFGRIYTYIMSNPLKWRNDEYYI